MNGSPLAPITRDFLITMALASTCSNHPDIRKMVVKLVHLGRWLPATEDEIEELDDAMDVAEATIEAQSAITH
tara:strand:- start:4259 stop:4477 length:219 start_codon:yes stop_codon:yes gene_type:complete